MAAIELPGYRVGELVGFGATGEVWRAVEVSTGDTVALKRLALAVDASTRVLTALRAEAALLAEVATPHLVRLRHVVEGVLVYDFADGGSLEALLSHRGTLEPGEVITLAMPLALTLSALHAAGLVHGDVAPTNVLFTADGMPLLSDVGLARIIAAGDASVGAAGPYADPALQGGPPTASSDVWALAALCHRLLTGAPPEPAKPQDGPLGQPAPEAPQALLAAVQAALTVDPALRPDAATFAQALRRSCAPAPVRLRGRPRASTAYAGESAGAATGPASPARRQIRISALRSRRGSDPHEYDGSSRAGATRLPFLEAGSARLGGLGWRRTVGRWVRSRPVQLTAGGALVLVLSALFGWQLGRAPVVEAALLEAAPPASVADRDTAPGRGPAPGRPVATPDADPTVRSTPRPAAGRPGPGSSGPGSSGPGSSGPGSSGPGSSGPGSPAPVRSGPVSPAPAGPAQVGSAARGPVRGSPVTAADWREVLDGLDALRARAFATADASVLTQVHAPGSAALRADQRAVTALARDRRFALGVRHSVTSLDVLPGVGTQVRLLVADKMAGARIVDRDGTPVQRRPPRGTRQWIIVVQPVDGGWRIASITAAGSSSGRR